MLSTSALTAKRKKKKEKKKTRALSASSTLGRTDVPWKSVHIGASRSPSLHLSLALAPFIPVIFLIPKMSRGDDPIALGEHLPPDDIIRTTRENRIPDFRTSVAGCPVLLVGYEDLGCESRFFKRASYTFSVRDPAFSDTVHDPRAG